MRYFLDTEYLWDARRGRIEPVSIGIVDDDGREFYAVSTAFKARHATQWTKDNVLTKLPDRKPEAPPRGSPGRWEDASAWMHPDDIARAILAFVGKNTPEFWGDYAAFDYVVLSMLMGEFHRWPGGWPMHVNDLQQAGIPSAESTNPHHALADARAVRDAYDRGLT